MNCLGESIILACFKNVGIENVIAVICSIAVVIRAFVNGVALLVKGRSNKCFFNEIVLSCGKNNICYVAVVTIFFCAGVSSKSGGVFARGSDNTFIIIVLKSIYKVCFVNVITSLASAQVGIVSPFVTGGKNCFVKFIAD